MKSLIYDEASDKLITGQITTHNNLSVNYFFQISHLKVIYFTSTRKLYKRTNEKSMKNLHNIYRNNLIQIQLFENVNTILLFSLKK